MSFEDRETSLVELKKIMFKSLYTWIAAHKNFPFLVFMIFWTFVFLFLPNTGFLLYTLYED
jgi:hypothetical protein